MICFLYNVIICSMFPAIILYFIRLASLFKAGLLRKTPLFVGCRAAFPALCLPLVPFGHYFSDPSTTVLLNKFEFFKFSLLLQKLLNIIFLLSFHILLRLHFLIIYLIIFFRSLDTQFK